MILDRGLGDHRIGLEVPISMKARHRAVTHAHLINASQGGIGIYSHEPIEAEALEIKCEHPGAESASDAQAEIVRQDDSGNQGIWFVKVPPLHQKALQP